MLINIDAWSHLLHWYIINHSFSSCSEFCGHQNDNISISPSDCPSSNAVEYELEPAPKVEEADEEKPDNEAAETTEKKQTPSDTGRRNHLVIFTVDISGSMNMTTQVPDLQGKSLF